MRAAGGTHVHSPGLLWRFWVILRGFEQMFVRPAPELPLVLIAYARGDRGPADELRGALEETWLTIPTPLRQGYEGVLKKVPPMVVVILRRKSPCGCLGHHHRPGTQTRIARRLSAVSGLPVAELDLAYQGIREWQPLPLSDLAIETTVPEANHEEVEVFRFRLGLLDVFLHELHHYASPQDGEPKVREHSQRFYIQVLDGFLRARFGIRYGLQK